MCPGVFARALRAHRPCVRVLYRSRSTVGTRAAAYLYELSLGGDQGGVSHILRPSASPLRRGDDVSHCLPPVRFGEPIRRADIHGELSRCRAPVAPATDDSVAAR